MSRDMDEEAYWSGGEWGEKQRESLYVKFFKT